jgi:hypothetical protein
LVTEIYFSEDRENIEICSQIKEYDIIGEKKFKNRSSKDKSDNIQTHLQAIYTSRLINFKNLPKPVNSSDLSSIQFNSGNLTVLKTFFLKICSYLLLL